MNPTGYYLIPQENTAHHNSILTGIAGKPKYNFPSSHPSRQDGLGPGGGGRRVPRDLQTALPLHPRAAGELRPRAAEQRLGRSWGKTVGKLACNNPQKGGGMRYLMAS